MLYRQWEYRIVKLEDVQVGLDWTEITNDDLEGWYDVTSEMRCCT
jgi:hypothetical protein